MSQIKQQQKPALWAGIIPGALLLLSAGQYLAAFVPGLRPWSIYISMGSVLLLLVCCAVALAYVALRASEPAGSEVAPLHRQFSILDLLVLTSVLALEVAALAQNNIVLHCLFITVSISVLALVWKRTLLRRVLLISMLLIYVAGAIFITWSRN
jgi:hypothetical protein